MRSWLQTMSRVALLGGLVGGLALAAQAADPVKPAAAAKPATPAAPAAAAAVPPKIEKIPVCTNNPTGLGISRVVEIDTTGGPGFGFEHYKAYDFLQPKEVVLTFDDGPWSATTKAVLDALAFHCTKATFFAIGKHALYHPEILKQVAAAGHSIGTHTFSHIDLTKLQPDQAKEEIEKGFSAVKLALGGAPASFFRFPSLRGPQDMEAYLGSRNIGIFSTDIDSFDFKHGKQPDAVVKTVMEKLEKKGKGIVLMHDFQKSTASALPTLLLALKDKGYKIVHLKSKASAATIASFDAELEKSTRGFVAGGASGGQPAASVFKTIAGEPQP
jgi:peptidoglycan/xylan/chitin deacetylase (PgdA/CDA1 family)